MKRISNFFCALFALFLSQTTFAAGGSGLLFDVSATGTPANFSITLCLNGKSALSCQNYTVSALNLSIRTTVPGHSYSTIGMKINTPGYALSGCTPIANGYCLFSANDTTPTSVAVSSTSTFSLGGTVSGLGTGQTVTLVNNATNATVISANGSFTFSTPVTEGTGYFVTVQTQPSNQTCTVAHGRGIMGGADVTNVRVTCATNAYTVGGAVSGLGSGQTVTLQNNDTNSTLISANGSFSFSTPIAEGSEYYVTIQTQPADQTCTVANGTGIMGGANVVNVTVTCSTNAYTVGGVVSGLGTGQTVTLQNNNTNSTVVVRNTGFTFSTPIAEGSPYNVTVQTQPADQTCTIVQGSGTMGGAPVTNVTVTCATNLYTVGGSVSGLGTGKTVTLLNNNTNPTTLSSNGSFTFSTAIAEGSAYNVTIQTQPTDQTCTVAHGSGIVGGAPVTNVTVTCSTNTHSVGGEVSGLGTGQTVTLQNNDTNSTLISVNGRFTFSTPIAEGSEYYVTVKTQPANQSCTVANGTGIMGSVNVINVIVTCSTNVYTVGGSVSGLGSGQTVTLLNNDTNSTALSSNGSFTFSTPIAEGSPYKVTIQTQPADQTCVLTNSTGVMGGAAVTNVIVTCTTNGYTVGGTISGLVGTVTLQNNGTNSTSISTDGRFTFSALVAEGSTYNVTVQTQPATQTCTVAHGSGTMGNSPVTNVTVTCAINTYSVGGTVSGLGSGQTVTLQNNDTNSTPISVNGSFTFSTPIAQGSEYYVTIQTQPADQTCSVVRGAGTMGASNVTNVTVTCSTNYHTVGGTVSGLATGERVTLLNNDINATPITSNSSFTFSTPVAEGSAYVVTIKTQPTEQTCTVTNGTGTMGASNVTNVSVTCLTNNTTLSVSQNGTITVSGASGTITVTNTGSVHSAYNVHAVLPGGWTGVTQDSSNCSTIAPNGSCTLSFTSAVPYVAQGNIIITGDNITSPPTTALGFTINGYYVWAIDSPSALEILDTSDFTPIQWGNPVSLGQDGTSNMYGAANTQLIANAPGIGYSAAITCNDSLNGGVSGWYLPAVCQLGAGLEAGCSSTFPNIYTNLISLGFGNITKNSYYWSSSQSGDSSSTYYAWSQIITGTGQDVIDINDKDNTFLVRCARTTYY